MNLAVKKHQFNPNKPDGMPDEWPWLCNELGESTQLPPGENWVLMTIAQFNEHKSLHQNAYNIYQAAKDFQKEKQKYLDDWDLKTKDYILKHYPSEKQQSIAFLMTMAKAENKTNRYNYLKQSVDWGMNIVLPYHYEKVAEYEACTTIAQLKAVVLDLWQFDSEDPEVGLAEAMAIND